MKILKRITLGSVNGVRGGFKNVTEKFRAATIYGVAHGSELKQKEDFADSYKFTGEFKAINKDGVPCVGTTAYVPSPIQEQLHIALQEGGQPVEFGINVFVIPDDDAVKGYILECEALTEYKTSTAIQGIEQRLAEKLPALEAPAKEPAPAPKDVAKVAAKGRRK